MDDPFDLFHGFSTSQQEFDLITLTADGVLKKRNVEGQEK